MTLATLVPASNPREVSRREICAGRGHPLAAGCHNPQYDLTLCPCGVRRVPGDHVVLPRLCPTCWYGDGPCSRLGGCPR